ncbi:prostacyclin synthase-like [Alosa sapidissima]|uniref:prostacyclin synthase-like n=1 Tax=Alosa sapidissima TaxID=34773 RepID=UPI001C08F6B3|nr:prostacyclin synthase-like [Alosa sapidissima]
MIWTVLLLVNGILFFLLLSTRSRSKREPPLDKGCIPWLGHALEFGKDAAKFLTRMKKKHGDIFTVRVAGHYVTVLLDPHSYDAVLQDSGSLDFSRYAQVLMDRIFKLRLPSHNPAVERAIMKQHFQGKNLTCLRSTMHSNLHTLLTSEMPHNQTNWKSSGLFNFCYGILFRAGYLTLFGGEQNNNGTDAKQIYKEYRKFDGLLTKMARTTLNSGEKRVAGGTRERLWELLCPAGLGESSSPWLRHYLQHLQEGGADADTQTRAMLLQLWATQGNVGPAAFWLLAFLISTPEAMKAVRTEFSRVSLTTDTAQAPTLDPTQPTPVFDSALEEALRLTAAPFITREVLQNKTLCMADGQEYDLRQGDRVCLFPFISPQMDPEIYHEPEKFLYDRFLNADGTPKRLFYKGGQRLKYYTMPWGAGSNACVGKPFAIDAIRQFVYLVLTHLEMELCEPEAGLPAVNTSRYGFGMVQPEGDMFIRYRQRVCHNIL